MAKVANKVFLIGPMGSGKSAVGKYLARTLQLPFVDSDAEIERRTGVDIPYIFDREGEAGFRQREHEALEELTQRPSLVLATGGGAVLLPENRRLLADHGFVVYLETAVEQQVERVRQSRNRPLLQDVDAAVKLRDLMTVRAPLYESLADVKVTTDHRRVQTVAAEIRAALKHLPQAQ